MAILKIDHIGVAVRNLEEAAGKFESLLGLKIAEQENVEDQQLIAALVATDDARFELMQPTAPESVVARFLERKGEGVHHICFEVDDIRAEIEALKSRDVQLVQGAPRDGFVGEVEFIHPRAAGSVLVEIAQVTLRTPTSCGLRLHHATIATKDSDGVSSLWKKNLHVIGHDGDGSNADASLLQGSHSHWVDAADDKGNALVEFRQSTDPHSTVAEFIEASGEGVFSLTAAAKDIETVPFHKMGHESHITPEQLVGLRIVLQGG